MSTSFSRMCTICLKPETGLNPCRCELPVFITSVQHDGLKVITPEIVQVASVNHTIREMPDKCRGLVSDGYHSFEELYEHRNMLFVALSRCISSTSMFVRPWKSRKQHDGTAYDGYFIAGFSFKGNQISYHLPDDLWGVLDAEERDYAPAWDGHTPNDVVTRLREWFGVDNG